MLQSQRSPLIVPCPLNPAARYATNFAILVIILLTWRIRHPREAAISSSVESSIVTIHGSQGPALWRQPRICQQGSTDNRGLQPSRYRLCSGVRNVLFIKAAYIDNPSSMSTSHWLAFCRRVAFYRSGRFPSPTKKLTSIWHWQFLMGSEAERSAHSIIPCLEGGGSRSQLQ